MVSKRVALCVTIACLLAWGAACTSDMEEPKPAPPDTDMDLNRLASWMTGSFSSGAQAAMDSAYFDIRLHMVPIWQNRTDAVWLYVEQATASHQDKPYRQRVYEVSQLDDSTFRSRVYLIPEPERFAGAWKQDRPLASLTPDSLELREGCSIILRPDGDSAFYGGTEGTNCESSLRGADYATSEVRLTSEYLYTWDRGWSESDSLVWGAETGGYVFEPYDPTATDSVVK